jgi:hypothetical protein
MLAVFTVTSLSDAPVTAAGQAPGTLRQAVFDANVSPGADTIEFSTGLSGTIDLSVVGDTSQNASALLVTSPITIRGNSNGITIGRAIDAPEMRLFRVAASGNLTLDTLMLTNGLVRGANGSSVGVAGSDARGGAIFNEGTVEIVASTLYGNGVIGGNATGALGGYGRGGAIANEGGTLTLKNSTVSGNSAISGEGMILLSSFGGGVHSLHGLLQIYNSTLTANSAIAGRQAYVFSDAGTATVELFSSIVGQSDIPSVATKDFLAINDVNGTINISASHNVVTTQTGLDSAQYISDDPQLGPLLANGGSTWTHAFAAESPALNSGANPLHLTVDQRGTGFGRSVGGVDIGAFELQSAPSLAGDYNGDGTVGAADYVVWRKTIGQSVSTYAGADGDGSGQIDPGDRGIWTQHYGQTTPSGSGANAPDDNFLSSQTSASKSADFASSWESQSSFEDLPEAAEVEPPLYATATTIRGKALAAAMLDWQTMSRRGGISFD